MGEHIGIIVEEMLIDRTQFHFVERKEMGALYATLALLYFGEGLVSIFVPIMLWKYGFSLSHIFLFYALNSIYFLILTFAFLPAFTRLSDKMMMFLSVPALILYFLGLRFVVMVPVLFYILPLVLAVNMLLFNVGYNLDFAKAAEEGKIGREIGMRDTIASLVQFGAPVLGGVLITTIGFQNTFFIASAILILAIFPLFSFPHRHLSSELKRVQIVTYLGKSSLAFFNLSGMGYAMEVVIRGIVWPFFIFLTLDSIVDLGGIISIGLFASAIVTIFVGYLSDSGRQRTILAWATGIYAFIYLVRTFISEPMTLTVSHVTGGIVYAALMVAWTSQFYKITRAVPDPSLFILSRQVLYHVARIIFLGLLIFLAYILSAQDFFTAVFGLTAIVVLFFLFANKFDLHTFIKETT